MEPRPLPTPSKISQPFWDSCRAGAMQIQRCEDCGTFAFYPVYICPECASRRLAWTPVSGRGAIYTFTVAEKASFDIEGPIVVALVELAEGAMMTSNIVNCDAESVAIGQEVRLVYTPVTEEITLPMFEPVTK